MPSIAQINPTEEIIRNYTAADFENRLNMFLEHRELREQFVAIDNREMQFSKAKRAAGGVRPRKTFVGRLRAALAGCCAI